MIIVISKIQIRRGTESELPGAPTSTNPLTFSDSLDSGEIAFTSDSGRMFIGPDKNVGNPNFQRPVFPYQNIEVLTEFSPKNLSLFNQNIKAQDRNAFYVPTIIPHGSNSVPLTYSEYDGAMPVPTKFYGETISATIEYHAFDSNSNPVQQGLIRVMGNSSSVQIDTSSVLGSGLTFTLSSYDSTHGCYSLLVSNTSSSNIAIILRTTYILGFSGPY